MSQPDPHFEPARADESATSVPEMSGNNNPAAPSPAAYSGAQQGAVAMPRNSDMAMASGYSFKSRNPILVWLVWPIITVGIYMLVWYYKIHKEMAEFDRRRQISASGPLLVLIFLGWTVIAPLISFHNTGVRIRNSQKAAGMPVTCMPLLCWLLVFAFGTNTLYMQIELNKITEHYGNVPEGTTVPLASA